MPYLLHLYLLLLSCQCKDEHPFPKNITSVKILVEEGKAYVVSTISLIKIHVLQVQRLVLYMQEHNMIND